MVYEVKIPQEDLNSEFAVLEKWYVNTGDYIKQGEMICAVETTKAVFEIESPKAGCIKILRNEGFESSFTEVIAVIGDSGKEVNEYKEETGILTDEVKYKITKKAKSLIEQYKIDTTEISTLARNMITERDVKKYITKKGDKFKYSAPASPGVLPVGMKLVGLIGAGFGLTQVIDILSEYHDISISGIYDDNESKWGNKMYGLKIRGGMDQCLEDFDNKKITHAVIAISTSISARKFLYEKMKNKGLRLCSAIDKNCQIKSDVVIGEGNVICSNVHIGNGTVIGNNNFISAMNSFDHHNVLGDHITTGPGVMTSGKVVIEDEAKFGTGIFVEPNIRIGRNSIISSGAVITKNIPSKSIVKSYIKYKIEEIK